MGKFPFLKQIRNIVKSLWLKGFKCYFAPGERYAGSVPIYDFWDIRKGLLQIVESLLPYFFETFCLTV